jgi:hypothetical protein
MSEGYAEGHALPPRIRRKIRPQSAPRYQELKSAGGLKNKAVISKKRLRPQTGHPDPDENNGVNAYVQE